MYGCTCHNTSFPPHFIQFHHFRFGFRLDPPDSSSCTITICDLLRCKKVQVPRWSVLSPSSPLWNRISFSFIPQEETEDELLENTKATFRKLPACYLFALDKRWKKTSHCEVNVAYLDSSSHKVLRDGCPSHVPIILQPILDVLLPYPDRRLLHHLKRVLHHLHPNLSFMSATQH